MLVFFTRDTVAQGRGCIRVIHYVWLMQRRWGVRTHWTTEWERIGMHSGKCKCPEGIQTGQMLNTHDQQSVLHSSHSQQRVTVISFTTQTIAMATKQGRSLFRSVLPEVWLWFIWMSNLHHLRDYQFIQSNVTSAIRLVLFKTHAQHTKTNLCFCVILHSGVVGEWTLSLSTDSRPWQNCD